MHICIGNLTIIGSDNGLSPGRRQAIIWANDGILLIRSLETNYSEILSKIHTFSFKKMLLKTLSAKWQPSCLGLNELTFVHIMASRYLNQRCLIFKTICTYTNQLQWNFDWHSNNFFPKNTFENVCTTASIFFKTQWQWTPCVSIRANIMDPNLSSHPGSCLT